MRIFPWPFWLKSVAILAQDGLGRVRVFYLSLSMATAADVCVTVASQAGKIWKRHRRALPPSAKALLAELLLDLRLHILPDSELDAVGNIGRAKYDIRGIAELLKFVSHSSNPNVEQAGPVPTPLQLGQHILKDTLAPPPTLQPLPTFLPPPPPPPLPEVDCALQCSQLEEFRHGLYNWYTIPECVITGEEQVSDHVIIDEASMVFTLEEADFYGNMAAGFPTEEDDKDQGSNATNGNVNENEPVMDDGNYVGDDIGLHPVPGINRPRGSVTTDNMGYDNDGSVTIVTETNDKDNSSPAVLVTGFADSAAECVVGIGTYVGCSDADPIDDDQGSNVTDTIDSAVTDIIDNGDAGDSAVTDIIDNCNGKYWRDRLMQEELASKKQKADKARGLYIFSEAFSHEHCSIFKPKIRISNLITDDAISVFLKTDASTHRMKKYKFLRLHADPPIIRMKKVIFRR